MVHASHLFTPSSENGSLLLTPLLVKSLVISWHQIQWIVSVPSFLVFLGHLTQLATPSLFLCRPWHHPLLVHLLRIWTFFLRILVGSAFSVHHSDVRILECVLVSFLFFSRSYLLYLDLYLHLHHYLISYLYLSSPNSWRNSSFLIKQSTFSPQMSLNNWNSSLLKLNFLCFSPTQSWTSSHIAHTNWWHHHPPHLPKVKPGIMQESFLSSPHAQSFFESPCFCLLAISWFHPLLVIFSTMA